MIGKVLGKCRVDEVIGDGSMGVVYRGHHMALDVPVAIKTIQPDLGGRQDVVQRLSQEAQLAARLRHGNIVRVYDVGEEHGHPYIVMEYLEGVSLDDHFGDERPEDLKLFIRIFHTIAAALGEAHNNGIIHRDMKPGNVMIVEGNKPMVMDFGIAGALRADNRLTAPGILMGTPAYMSPEQAAGDLELDGRTDVFSVGLMMYEALTGVLPHETDNLLGLLAERVNSEVTPLHELVPDIPAPLAAVVMRCLARDAHGRFPEGTSLAAGLADAYREMYPPVDNRGSQPTGQLNPLASLDLPSEESRAIVSTVDLRYTDLHAVFRGVEHASTGFGLMVLRYRRVADLLLFNGRDMAAAFRWDGERFSGVGLDLVYALKDSGEVGYVDSWEISERYFNALALILAGAPSIGGMKLAFVKLPELFSYLGQSGHVGVLKLQLRSKLGWVLFRKGTAPQLFCGNWLSYDAADVGQALPKLASVLARHPLTDVEFYATTRKALKTQEIQPGTHPFEPADAQALVDFVVDTLQVSGEALHKAFGLGAAPIMNKQLDTTADTHGWLAEGLQLTDRMTLDADNVLGCIDRLPHTDRRRVVVDAMGSILEGRLSGIRDTLPNKRKRKKVLKGVLDVWSARESTLATRALAAPFEPIIQSVRQELA